MIWTAYKIVLRLLTPLHVGAGALGNVQRARPYLLGKTLWGALTARLTRDVPGLGGDYVAVGHQVDEELALSYFYPAVCEQVDIWPWDGPDNFAWRYLGTYAGTALDYVHSAAEEGSLHETEFIAPVTRDGCEVYLVGYIFEQMGSSLPWRKVLSQLQLGGERGYGWGQVKVERLDCLSADAALFERFELSNGHADRPVLRAVEEAPLLAHALAADFTAHGKLHRAVQGVSGSVEPLVGRETRVNEKRGFGAYLPRARICWQPGCTIDAGTQAAIGPYGIWESVS